MYDHIDYEEGEKSATSLNFLIFSFQLFLLEETRDRKFDSYARMIQKAFRKHFSQQMLLKQKEEAAGKIVLI